MGTFQAARTCWVGPRQDEVFTHTKLMLIRVSLDALMEKNKQKVNKKASLTLTVISAGTLEGSETSHLRSTCEGGLKEKKRYQTAGI